MENLKELSDNQLKELIKKKASEIYDIETDICLINRELDRRVQMGLAQ